MSKIIEELVEELAEEKLAKKRVEEKVRLAKQLVMVGIISIADISKVTGLSEEQILKAQEDVKIANTRCKIVEQLKEEGREEAKLEIIHKMGSKGYSIEQITDITGYSKEEVEKGC